jgi:hypothetical protein
MNDGIDLSLNHGLGSPIQDYRVALSNRVAVGVVSIVGGGFALLFAFVLVFGVQRSPNDLEAALLFYLIFALPIGLLGLFVIWRFIELCALQAIVHTAGIRFRTLRRERSASWAEVSSLVTDGPGPPNLLALLAILAFCWILIIPYVLSRLFPRFKYSLCLQSGARMRIPRALAAKTSLIAAIDAAIVRDQLADMLGRFQHGLPSHFGAFSIEADGLHARGALLPWRDVHLVTRSASGIAVFRRGAQSAWCSAPLRAVPNATLFQTVVSIIQERIVDWAP